MNDKAILSTIGAAMAAGERGEWAAGRQYLEQALRLIAPTGERTVLPVARTEAAQVPAGHATQLYASQHESLEQLRREEDPSLAV